MKNESYYSNKFYYRLFRNVFLFVALVLLFSGTVGFFFPELVQVNDTSITMTGVIILYVLSCFSLLFHLLLKDKFVYVRVCSDGILVINSKIKKSYRWHEVDIKQIPFVFPPLYKLKTLGQESTLLFNTENKYILVSIGLVKDISQMGEFIRLRTKS